jgi:hypothetical protein
MIRDPRLLAVTLLVVLIGFAVALRISGVGA